MVVSNTYAEVIGDPIAHSKSPIIHGFWLEQLGIAGAYRRAHVRPDELEGYLAGRRDDPDWRGCNVTIPHKQAVIPLLDALDPLAAKVGAVNTIVREGDRLIGHNSDVAGFLEPLRPRLAERHLLRTARILGAGGAARAIAHGLAAEGFTLIIAARRIEAAESLAAEFGEHRAYAATLSHFAEPIEFDWGETGEDRLDLLVNATSLGMAGQPALNIDFSTVPPEALVYDAVYAPRDTALLVEARRRGLPTIGGLAMLIGQARIAFRLFFGAEPPADAQSDAALAALLTA